MTMKRWIVLALCTPALGQVTITQQFADQAAIPGSVRSVYANVQGTPNLQVKWTATGGCTLASPTTAASPQTVTAPATGGSCKFATATPTPEVPNFSSPVSCTITATSAADPSRSASLVIPVCAPTVTLKTFPFSTVLYKRQVAVIQSDLRGSVNTAVTWAITTNPGNAGALTGGAGNRHAIFSATAPGTYILTATSVADPRKKSSTTISVTPHDLPAPNGDHTEAVDCTATGRGKVYDVGPERHYPNLNAIFWNGLKGGDTVRVFNDDTTGTNPTEYHQRIALSASGNATEPIRICGVPDAHGAKPIIDGTEARARPDGDWAGGGSLESLGLIMLYDGMHKFDPDPDSNQNIVIEGLHIRNVNPTIPFSRLRGEGASRYDKAAACIRVQTGRGIFLRGNDLESCGQAVFANSQTPEGGIVYDLTVQGNYIHQWGAPHSDRQHAMYLQAIGLVVQFNYFGEAMPGVPGNIIKSRSILNFLRWNYISQLPTTARSFDMVEPQAFACSVIPFQFAVAYHGGGAKTDCNTPHGGANSDSLSPNQVAASFEAYHSDYIYGNVIDDAGSGSGFVHYGYDQQTAAGPRFDRRGGTLFYWNNTHLEHTAKAVKPIFDVSAPDQGNSYEFPSVQSVNNIFATAAPGQYLWTRAFWSQIVVNSNWMAPGYALPNRATQDTYQGGATPAEAATCDPYGNCHPGNGHMIWARDGKPGTAPASLYTGPTPFDPKTYRPGPRLHGIAARLPTAIADQPSNMQYLPATNTIAPRTDTTTLGALD